MNNLVDKKRVYEEGAVLEHSELLVNAAEKINIEIDKIQIEKFDLYMKLLLEWNQKINLTAIIEEKEIILKHFIDSLTCAKYINLGDKIIDVGAGAGFPGIPIKLVNTSVNSILLMDSLNKRIKFLKEIIDKLKLEGISAVHGRAEDMGNNYEYREKFDVVVARAVSKLSVLVEYCLPFAKIGGRMLSMKGGDVEEEVKQAQKAIRILGGEVVNIEKISLPFSEIRHSIVEIKKVNTTPRGYPRKAGMPDKEPIGG